MLTQRLTRHTRRRMRFIFKASWHFDVLPHLPRRVKHDAAKLGYRKKHAIRLAVDYDCRAIVRVYFKPCQEMITKNKKKGDYGVVVLRMCFFISRLSCSANSNAWLREQLFSCLMSSIASKMCGPTKPLMYCLRSAVILESHRHQPTVA